MDDEQAIDALLERDRQRKGYGMKSEENERRPLILKTAQLFNQFQKEKKKLKVLKLFQLKQKPLLR